MNQCYCGCVEVCLITHDFMFDGFICLIRTTPPWSVAMFATIMNICHVEVTSNLLRGDTNVFFVGKKAQ